MEAFLNINITFIKELPADIILNLSGPGSVVCCLWLVAGWLKWGRFRYWVNLSLNLNLNLIGQREKLKNW